MIGSPRPGPDSHHAPPVIAAGQDQSVRLSKNIPANARGVGNQHYEAITCFDTQILKNCGSSASRPTNRAGRLNSQRKAIKCFEAKDRRPSFHSLPAKKKIIFAWNRRTSRLGQESGEIAIVRDIKVGWCSGIGRDIFFRPALPTPQWQCAASRRSKFFLCEAFQHRVALAHRSPQKASDGPLFGSHNQLASQRVKLLTRRNRIAKHPEGAIDVPARTSQWHQTGRIRSCDSTELSATANPATRLQVSDS